MTVQLETKPVLSQPDSSGWCRTIVLASSPQQINPEDQPVWLISLASNSPDTTASGISLLESLESTYHSLELKTAEALYQVLDQHSGDFEDLSIAAACITLTTATLITKGTAEVVLIRQGQLSSLLKNQDSSWQAVEGNWYKDDIWWLSAGHIGTLDNLTPKESLEYYRQSFEDITISLSQQTEIAEAGLFFEFVEATETSVAPVISPLVKKKRRVMALGLAVLVLLLASIFIGAKTRETRLLNTRYETLQTQVTETLTAANSLYPTDQIKAREQIKTLLDDLNNQKSSFDSNSNWQTKWQALFDQANQSYQQISGEIALTDLPIWYPLNTIKPEFTGNLMAQAGNNLVVWDQATSTLVTIGIENKRNDIVAGGADLSGATSLAVDGNRAVMLTSRGIVDIALNRNSVTVLVETDPEWQLPSLVGLFNNNVYLVDPTAGTLWRYPAITGGVGAKQNWFGPGVSLSGTDYVKLAIDGQLWLLQSSGKLTRYTRGAPQSFAFSGFDLPLGTTTPTFALHPEKDLVAILDVANNRVVLTTKNGEYQKQIVWLGFSAVQDIAFSPNQDTLFILSQGNIYAANY